MQLDESGQSGIDVWNDRLFLTVLKPWEMASEDKASIKTTTIRAIRLNALNGETIWEYEIDSEGESGYMYGFNDLTSATPITDGEFVWFTNAGGNPIKINSTLFFTTMIGNCYTFD